MMNRLPLAAALSLCLSSAIADEGMWTFNNFPAAKVGQAYGFTPDQAWLDHVRMASVRIAGGCSASLVSSEGLVMTNHHCARSCIENVSGLTHKDYNRDGFYAKTVGEEARCPGMEMNQLVEITDVTKRVQDATRDATPATFNDVQKATLAAIEKECGTSDELRCEVVTLYEGGRYDLYKYRRYQDVRLVFAPEDRIAFFGGDPDNFNFPRYDLDVSMVRIYGSDGKPLHNAEHLSWSDGKLKDGDLTFVSGNPGGTARELTMAQFDDERDDKLVRDIALRSELRGYLTEYGERGAEQKRQSNDMLFGTENGLKVFTGRHEALSDKAFYGQLAANEKAFRAKVMADPALAQAYGGVWDAIGELVRKDEIYRTEYTALERGIRYSSLFTIARNLVRHGDEVAKPNGERLREFGESRLPQMKAVTLANEPIYDELEIATLTWSLTRMRADLGADSPIVKRVFGKRSPAQIATDAVRHTRLKELQVGAHGNAIGGYRKALYDGGKAAVDASHDPMIELARALDPDARAIRKKVETEVDGPMKRQQELLAKARFAVYGDSKYPDATFTLRLSYGTVKGWTEGDHAVAPFTTIAGAFDRATGADPFQLPDSWIKDKPRLDLSTPMNVVTTNDIIGGNSGSPLVNRKGEVAGLIFDGNIHSLGGDYGYDPALNRAVAVDSAALLEAMDKVYGAGRLVKEIKGSPTKLAADKVPTGQ
ncbi:S46 family peptidase [Scleromatobacter humisilvae]|uniref:Dipeptidyl-peptidase n=1 Tax=Scleromatobacter humisilvae TaxID=2897159 RepID=A0A9X1YDZ6_9BURK|nr:S46 family peptidase [Scleromatobacter humisilvae]MCK9684434.1 S46 family peptidase [Scleromatobacter humisilvae]